MKNETVKIMVVSYIFEWYGQLYPAMGVIYDATMDETAKLTGTIFVWGMWVP